MTPVAVEIQDSGKGRKSVADDLEAVLRKIEHWHQGSIAHYRIKLPEHSRDRAPGRMGRENGASALSSDPTRALAYTIAKRKGLAAYSTHLNETRRSKQLCFH